MNKLLVLAAGDDYIVGAQGPLAVDDISEPQPDFTILPTGLDYMQVLPELAHLLAPNPDGTWGSIQPQATERLTATTVPTIRLDLDTLLDY